MSPYDTFFVSKRFLDHWKPDLACRIESEIWPRILFEIAKRDIPNYLFNETSTMAHWIDISDPSNNTFTDRLYKFQDSFIRATKIIYFTERYYFLLVKMNMV